MPISIRLAFLVVVLAGGCSKTANPEVCCTDPVDCSSIGAEEDSRSCPTALACVNHECVVPDCSTQGCPMSAPVCSLETNACDGCTSNADCANFNDQQRCLVDTGACVQCVTSNDCGLTLPVCSGNNTCRKCELDSECASGACADDGTCVLESGIVYVDPLGSDGGDCSKASPCRTIQGGIPKLSPSRVHIILAKATYGLTGALTIFNAGTTAPSLTLHGGDATIVANSGDPALISDIPLIVRDLTFQELSGAPSIDMRATSGTNAIERVTIEAKSQGVTLAGTTRLRDVTLRGMPNGGLSYGIDIGDATVDIDRVSLSGFDTCITSNGASSIATIRNVIAVGCGVRALDLNKTSGLTEFSTLVTQNAGTGTGPRVVECGTFSQMTLRGNIVWAPNATQPAVAGCALVSSIVGPTAVAGSSNADPRFVDLANGDFHLQSTSPARDVLDMGPMTDFAGNPRPLGGRYDQGAYEQ